LKFLGKEKHFRPVNIFVLNLIFTHSPYLSHLIIIE